MGRCRRFTVLFILLLLLSELVVVSHQHNTIVDDNDCPFCIAINDQTASASLAVAFDGTPFLTVTRFIASAPALTDILSFVSSSTRSPPA
jgi:hypothetical protein